MLQVPIFHVNGDDPEAVVHVTDLALQFRQHFGCDVIVDIFCYRRHGHNEGDEPSFTHPKMYRLIRYRTSVTKMYIEKILASAKSARKYMKILHKIYNIGEPGAQRHTRAQWHAYILQKQDNFAASKM